MPNVERRVSIAKTARSNIDTLAAVGVHSRWRGRDTRLATYYTCTCAGARCKKNRVKEKAGSGSRVSLRPARIVVARQMPRQSPSSSRGPPTPRFRRFSAFRSAVEPPTTPHAVL